MGAVTCQVSICDSCVVWIRIDCNADTDPDLGGKNLPESQPKNAYYINVEI